MSDRQRRYRERLKAGRRVHPVEASDVDVEILQITGCVAYRLLQSAGYSLDEVIELTAWMTRNASLFEILLHCFAEANRIRNEVSAEHDRASEAGLRAQLRAQGCI